MTRHDTSKPERPATSPRSDFVGPIRDLEVDPANVGELRIVEPQEGDVPNENH
ncbi:MAG: hypothetical protein ABSH29_24755 [Acidimicrobiales bacterium]|jgi:hypothetical protein